MGRCALLLRVLTLLLRVLTLLLRVLTLLLRVLTLLLRVLTLLLRILSFFVATTAAEHGHGHCAAKQTSYCLLHPKHGLNALAEPGNRLRERSTQVKTNGGRFRIFAKPHARASLGVGLC